LPQPSDGKGFDDRAGDVELPHSSSYLQSFSFTEVEKALGLLLFLSPALSSEATATMASASSVAGPQLQQRQQQQQQHIDPAYQPLADVYAMWSATGATLVDDDDNEDNEEGESMVARLDSQNACSYGDIMAQLPLDDDSFHFQQAPDDPYLASVLRVLTPTEVSDNDVYHQSRPIDTTPTSSLSHELDDAVDAATTSSSFSLLLESQQSRNASFFAPGPTVVLSATESGTHEREGLATLFGALHRPHPYAIFGPPQVTQSQSLPPSPPQMPDKLFLPMGLSIPSLRVDGPEVPSSLKLSTWFEGFDIPTASFPLGEGGPQSALPTSHENDCDGDGNRDATKPRHFIGTAPQRGVFVDESKSHDASSPPPSSKDWFHALSNALLGVSGSTHFLGRRREGASDIFGFTEESVSQLFQQLASIEHSVRRLRMFASSLWNSISSPISTSTSTSMATPPPSSSSVSNSLSEQITSAFCRGLLECVDHVEGTMLELASATTTSLSVCEGEGESESNSGSGVGDALRLRGGDDEAPTTSMQSLLDIINAGRLVSTKSWSPALALTPAAVMVSFQVELSRRCKAVEFLLVSICGFSSTATATATATATSTVSTFAEPLSSPFHTDVEGTTSEVNGTFEGSVGVGGLLDEFESRFHKQREVASVVVALAQLPKGAKLLDLLASKFDDIDETVDKTSGNGSGSDEDSASTTPVSLNQLMLEHMFTVSLAPLTNYFYDVLCLGADSLASSSVDTDVLPLPSFLEPVREAITICSTLVRTSLSRSNTAAPTIIRNIMATTTPNVGHGNVDDIDTTATAGRWLVPQDTMPICLKLMPSLSSRIHQHQQHHHRHRHHSSRAHARVCDHPPPFDVLLHRYIVDPVRKRCNYVEGAMVQRFLAKPSPLPSLSPSSLSIMPGAKALVEGVFDGLLHIVWNALLPSFESGLLDIAVGRAFPLSLTHELALRSALAALPSSTHLSSSFSLSHNDPSNGNKGGQQQQQQQPQFILATAPKQFRGIDLLDNIEFDCRTQWPLSAILSATDGIAKYNKMFRLLLKLRRADEGLTHISRILFCEQRRFASSAVKKCRQHRQQQQQQRPPPRSSQHPSSSTTTTTTTMLRTSLLPTPMRHQVELLRYWMHRSVIIIRGFIIAQVTELLWGQFEKRMTPRGPPPSQPQFYGKKSRSENNGNDDNDDYEDDDDDDGQRVSSMAEIVSSYHDYITKSLMSCFLDDRSKSLEFILGHLLLVIEQFRQAIISASREAEASHSDGSIGGTLFDLLEQEGAVKLINDLEDTFIRHVTDFAEVMDELGKKGHGPQFSTLGSLFKQAHFFTTSE
jgi:hypothetical protein